MRGTTVTVLKPIAGAADRFGNPTVSGFDREEVAGVLIAPGASADLEASRPAGSRVSLTLHFPKAWGGASLRGCSVELPAPWAGIYRVVGDPKSYDAANTPTRWNMPVEVEACDG